MPDTAMTVTLRPITVDNWIDCIKLKPADAQANFVAPNSVSLTQASFERWWQTMGIYAGETMVGFAMYGTWPAGDLPAYYPEEMPVGLDYIMRFMIDEHQQRKGYGRAALALILDTIRRRPGAFAVELSYEPDNAVAAALYAGLGFQPTGEIHGGETVARLTFTA
jgi:diamine N-acetyltransferase